MAEGMHSTGRGGAGNIGIDSSTVYTDGGIVREGHVGESSHPEYSSGRGGAGNIVDSPKVRAAASEDYIPETSIRTSGQYENFHTGRGGGGNVYKEKYGGHSTPQKDKHGSGANTPHKDTTGKEHEGLGDKVKHIFGMDKKKNTET